MINIKVAIFTIISIVFIIEYNHRVFVCGKANFDVFGKSFKHWIDKEWGYVIDKKSCALRVTKASRGGKISCTINLIKPVEYIYVHLQLFYRYGTIYRNYLFDYPKFEPCELVKKDRSLKYSNPLADLMLSAIKACCPITARGCPFYGWFNVSNIDINATVAPFLPPVVPTGHYKVYARFYLDDNKTISEVEGVGVVKANFANRDKDFSMLNMG